MNEKIVLHLKVKHNGLNNFDRPGTKRRKSKIIHRLEKSTKKTFYEK